MSTLLHLLRRRGAGTPSDTTDPQITVGPAVGSITGSGATVTWTTDEDADSLVRYGTSIAYGAESTLDSNKTTAHSVVLADLTENTLYHFQVVSADTAGNDVVSADGTFTTLDVTAATITGVLASETSRATNVAGAKVTVTWTTDEVCSSKVEYGTVVSGAFASSTAEADTSPRVTSHSVVVTGLTAEVAYQFRPVSVDNGANSTTGATVLVTTEWTPSLLVAKTVLWLEAGLETGADLSTTQTPQDWSNTNAGLLTQATAGSRPVLHNAGNASFANGKPTWEFDGTADSWIRTTDTDAWDLTGDTAALVVFTRAAGLAAKDVFISKSDVTTNTLRWAYGITSAEKAYVFNDGKGSDQVSTLSFDDGINHGVIWNRTGTTTTFSADGASALNTFTSMSSTAPTGTTRVGAVTSGANLYAGMISVLILFNDDLTAGEITKLWAYIQPRYTTVPDVTAPVLSAVAATETKASTHVAGASITVTWTTDEASSSIVDYDTDATGAPYATSTAEADTAPRVTSHSVVLTGLVENTTYYIRPRSKDATGNTGSGSEVTVTTAWTPKALGAEVKAWYEARLETTTDNTTVQTPTDWSNNAVGLTQATAGARPTFHRIGANGAACWTFDGTDDLWAVADVAALDLNGSDCSFVAAYRCDAQDDNGHLLSHFRAAGATGWHFGVNSAGKIFFSTEGGGSDLSTLTTFADGLNHGLALVKAGTDVQLSVDSGAHDLFTSVSWNAPDSEVAVGGRTGGSAFYAGDILFLLVTSDDLTAGELDLIWDYMANEGVGT